MRIPSLLLAALVATPLAACVTKKEVVEPSPRAAPTMVAVSGSLNYTTGGRLPAGALVTVQALDPTRPGTVISESRWNITDEQVPIPFNLPIDQVWFTSGKRLTITATIQVDGKAAYVTTVPYVTNGAVPPGPVSVTLAPAH